MSIPSVERVIPRPSDRQRRAPSGADIRVVADEIRVVDAASESSDKSGNWFALFGAAASLLAMAAFGYLGLTDRADTTSGLVLVPLFAIVGYFAIRRWISLAYGNWLGSVIFAGFGLRLLAAAPRLLGGADAPVYQREGVRIARSLRQFDLTVETGRSVPGTGSVRYLSGIVNVFTGGSYMATFLVFVTMALVGQATFLLGVRRSLAPRQFRAVAVLVAFSPTLAFWPSSVGKESPTLFGIGLAVFGASRLYDRRWSGAPPVLLGVFAIGMVRPHVAMVVLAAVLMGLFARRAHTRGRLASHSALLLVVLLGSMWAANASAELFGLESLDGFSDVSAALDFTEARTTQDQSQFTAARVETPLDYPRAAVTVLFRPFPWEADSAVGLLSSIEGIFMMLLVLGALPGMVWRAGKVLQTGQLLLAVSFTSVFIYLFSAIGNFGILSRQRAQVVPFVLLLIAFGLAASEKRRRVQP